MRRPATFVLPLLGVLLLTAGCQKLNFEKSVQLSLGDVQVFPVDPPKREQKVIVNVSSPEPVNVYVVLDKD